MGKKETALVVFESKKIRRVWHNEEWWFSVVDIIAALTQSDRARKYWSDLKKELESQGFELSGKIGQLKLASADGKKYATDCANTETMFRIMQAVPSPRAEPFKRWLAEIGYERIQEIENPELAQDRVREYYELKGYPKDWIDKRLRGIAIRQDLTSEWAQRGIEEHKEFKGLQRKNQNLRDHMTDLELIFTMLGERATTEITQEQNSSGFNQCKTSAKEGGKIAGDARKALEKKTKKPVSTKQNYLGIQEKKKLNSK